jgi:hypothetical protein
LLHGSPCGLCRLVKRKNPSASSPPIQSDDYRDNRDEKSFKALVSWVRNSQTKAFNAGQDVVGGFGPDKRFGIGVVELEVMASRILQLKVER